jgi:hypothetical protein
MKTREPMSKEEQEQQRIDDIIDELASLSLRTSNLTSELKRLQQIGRQGHRAKPTNPRYDHDFKEGDLVVITNSYLGRKGTKGKVSYVTKTQVTLQDSSGKFHTRRFTNIKR